MRWFELLFILFHVKLSFRVFLLKDMMSSYMTSLNSYHSHICYLIRLEKLCTYMLFVFALSFVKLCVPYEERIMLLKSRPHTYHPNMHYSYTRGR
jgi:hypothetical protein